MNAYARPQMIFLEDIVNKKIVSMGIQVGMDYGDVYEAIDRMKLKLENDEKKKREEDKKLNEDKKEDDTHQSVKK